MTLGASSSAGVAYCSTGKATISSITVEACIIGDEALDSIRTG